MSDLNFLFIVRWIPRMIPAKKDDWSRVKIVFSRKRAAELEQSILRVKTKIRSWAAAQECEIPRNGLSRHPIFSRSERGNALREV